jgi:hypothetical protein
MVSKCTILALEGVLEAPVQILTQSRSQIVLVGWMTHHCRLLPSLWQWGTDSIFPCVTPAWIHKDKFCNKESCNSESEKLLILSLDAA